MGYSWLASARLHPAYQRGLMDPTGKSLQNWQELIWIINAMKKLPPLTSEHHIQKRLPVEYVSFFRMTVEQQIHDYFRINGSVWTYVGISSNTLSASVLEIVVCRKKKIVLPKRT